MRLPRLRLSHRCYELLHLEDDGRVGRHAEHIALEQYIAHHSHRLINRLVELHLNRTRADVVHHQELRAISLTIPGSQRVRFIALVIALRERTLLGQSRVDVTQLAKLTIGVEHRVLIGQLLLDATLVGKDRRECTCILRILGASPLHRLTHIHVIALLITRVGQLLTVVDDRTTGQRQLHHTGHAGIVAVALQLVHDTILVVVLEFRGIDEFRVGCMQFVLQLDDILRHVVSLAILQRIDQLAAEIEAKIFERYNEAISLTPTAATEKAGDEPSLMPVDSADLPARPRKKIDIDIAVDD